MTKTMRSLLSLALPAFAALYAGQASAESGSVTIFERPPSIQELRNLVEPDMPIRTRGIEILGKVVDTAQRVAPAPQSLPASYVPQPEAPSTAQTQVQAPAPPPAPAPAVAAAPQLEPEPAPQPAQAAPDTTSPSGGIFGFRINFAFNSAEIPEDFHPFMDSVGQLMTQEPELALLIEGHTDAVGGGAYNQTLSERRAEAARQYLVSVHGVAPDRLVVRGRGEDEPMLADPHDGKNRRVEFERIR